MGMDVTSLSVTLNQLSKPTTNQDVGVALLSKQLDNAEQAGPAMVKMMEQSVNPSVGGNFDQYI